MEHYTSRLNRLEYFLALIFLPYCVEIGCYLVCFAVIIRHDNTHAKSVLTSDTLRRRNTSNAISLSAHVAVWAFRMVFSALITAIFFGNSEVEVQFVGGVLRSTDFGLEMTVLMMCTPSVRRKFANQIRSLTSLISEATS